MDEITKSLIIIYSTAGVIVGIWVGGIIAYLVSEKKRMIAEDKAEAYKQSFYYLKNKRKSDDNLS